MTRITLAAILIAVGGLPAGCTTTGRVYPAHVGALPIVFNDEPPRSLDYQALGKIGERVTLHGMLRNSRKWQESEQEQWLLASLPDAPFSKYSFRLAKPVLQLPPCYVQFADPPGKSLVGPYKVSGRLAVGWTDAKLTYSRRKYYQVADAKLEEFQIPRSIPRACATAVRQHWQEIGRSTVAVGIPGTPEDRNSSRLPLSDFVRQHEPILLRLSIDGKRALYCCAEGRKHLSWHGEALARVYCLVDLARKRPLRLYVERSAYALE